MKKLLVVVDYQNDFVDGSLGFKRAKEIESNIVNKIQSNIVNKILNYKDENQDVVFTLDTHYENYMSTKEGKNLPVPHCLKGQKRT